MEQRLRDLLAGMKVPKSKTNLVLANLMWLHRNLAINNLNHPDFREAKLIIRTMLRNMTAS